MQIMQLLLSGQIEQKTAGLLFHGLQIASSNLKYTNFEPETKNEIVIDPRRTSPCGRTGISKRPQIAKSTSTTRTSLT